MKEFCTALLQVQAILWLFLITVWPEWFGLKFIAPVIKGVLTGLN